MPDKQDPFDRILGALLGAAIGDALGGPVEGKPYSEIERLHGFVDRFLPYGEDLWAFYAWKSDPGTITDDTRLRNVFIDAVIEDGSHLRREVLAKVLIERYEAAEPGFEHDWLEEYALSAMRDRLYCGGYPGNGGLISSLPAALVFPGQPEQAYRSAFEAILIDQGYGRDCSSTHCAIAAIALTSDADFPDIIAQGVAAAPAELADSRYFGRPLERHLEKVRKTLEAGSAFEQYREAFYAELTWPETYDSMETFGFAMGVLLACPDDPQRAVLEAVNLGRDNDSTATLVGGLMGCRFGTDAWPADWIETVSTANPEIDFEGQALALTRIAATHAV